jgi:quercetin dioxygenase-like cupin family protein
MMKSTLPSKGLAVSLAFLVCCAAIVSVNASDPDPLVDNPGGDNNFVLRDVFTNGAVTQGPGGTRAALNITGFPALVNEGITYVQFKMEPCGENLPHTHPRATEILTLVSGGPLQAGLVNTSGVSHIYILYPGDVIVFPRGLLHYELNVGTEQAFYISALNSQNPGVLTAGGVLFALPTRALATSLNQDPGTVEKLRSQIYTYSDILQKDDNSGCVPGQGITTDY